VKIVKSAPSNDDVEAATEQHEHFEVQMACTVLGLKQLMLIGGHCRWTLWTEVGAAMVRCEKGKHQGDGDICRCRMQLREPHLTCKRFNQQTEAFRIAVRRETSRRVSETLRHVSERLTQRSDNEIQQTTEISRQRKSEWRTSFCSQRQLINEDCRVIMNNKDPTDIVRPKVSLAHHGQRLLTKCELELAIASGLNSINMCDWRLLLRLTAIHTRGSPTRCTAMIVMDLAPTDSLAVRW
jgi:hypothetical protein